MQVQAARPEHSEVPKALARLFHRTGQAQRAVQVLQAHLEDFPQQVSPQWHCTDPPQRIDCLAQGRPAQSASLGAWQQLPICPHHPRHILPPLQTDLPTSFPARLSPHLFPSVLPNAFLSCRPT